jgi:ATP-binding protein involved in chromosome partitioning
MMTSTSPKNSPKKSSLSPHKTQLQNIRIPGVKNILAVASGKGGVGKSTVSVNLALAFQALGLKTGILDADIYGPSQPLMLGTSQESPETTDQKSLEPIMKYGLQTMSIGYLVEDQTAMIWRGPMASKALQQILNDTRWKDLDILIVDLPPGTGDIQLTLSQKIPVTGGVIVTTPQDLSLLDATRALKMFEKVGIHLFGIIENMSSFSCPHCQKNTALFGEGGAAKMAQEHHLDVLAELPLSLLTRECTDHGKPIVIQAPESPESQLYIELAKKLILKINERPKNYADKFGVIKIEKS